MQHYMTRAWPKIAPAPAWLSSIRYFFMKPRRLVVTLLCLANAFCGCCFHKDLTESAQVQASGMLGQGFHTTEPLDLIEDRHTRTFFLAKRDIQEGMPHVDDSHLRSEAVANRSSNAFWKASPRDQFIGAVDAGTELRVNRVERVSELIAILVVLPEYWHWNCTLAKIEAGPYAGKEVAVAGEGLLFKQDPATNGSTMLVPTIKVHEALHATVAPHGS